MLAVKSLQEVNGVGSDILPLFSACHISAWVEAMDKNKYLEFDPPAWVVFASQILDLNCTSTLVQNSFQLRPEGNLFYCVFYLFWEAAKQKS